MQVALCLIDAPSVFLTWNSYIELKVKSKRKTEIFSYYFFSPKSTEGSTGTERGATSRYNHERIKYTYPKILPTHWHRPILKMLWRPRH